MAWYSKGVLFSSTHSKGCSFWGIFRLWWNALAQYWSRLAYLGQHILLWNDIICISLSEIDWFSSIYSKTVQLFLISELHSPPPPQRLGLPWWYRPYIGITHFMLPQNNGDLPFSFLVVIAKLFSCRIFINN